MSSAKFSSATIFKVSNLWKCCTNVKQLGSGWDAELLGVSSGSKLFEYGTIVVLGGLRVNGILDYSFDTVLQQSFFDDRPLVCDHSRVVNMFILENPTPVPFIAKQSAWFPQNWGDDVDIGYTQLWHLEKLMFKYYLIFYLFKFKFLSIIRVETQ